MARRGRHTPFTLGPFDLPVVDGRVGRKLKNAAPDDLQLIPVLVGEVEAAILNVLTCVDCIDDEHTLADKWTAEDGRPDKVGSYRTVARLVIDPQRAAGVRVLRPAKWTLALVVSRDLLVVVDSGDLVGVTLVPVT
jgi:hypothetical protein